VAYTSELDFEKDLINLLFEKGWEKEVLKFKTEEDLINNWADILFNNNRGIDQLNDVPLTRTEMQQLLDEIAELRSPLNLNAFINGKTTSIIRDNPEDKLHFGKSVTLKIFDRLEIKAGKSRYQIAEQPIFTAKTDMLKDRRGDFMLLINGMPLIHVELKKTGIPIEQAQIQIMKYAKEGVFTGLFSLIQIFVAMTPDETKYFANPGPDGMFNEDFFFHWADFNNEPINDWKRIASEFLYIPMAHQMIGFYTVADDTDGVLKAMRSYQYYAANKIEDRVTQNDWTQGGNDLEGILGGHVWHTTGSGKTMTSYKSAQLIADSGLADKVVFLMDRIELGTQSLLQYRGFADSNTQIQSTDNTRVLVSKLKSDNVEDTLIVTSIQKMSNIGEDGPVTTKDMEKINSKRIVFIVDECHRSTFGNMLTDIKKACPYALFFGFTGTPIHEENSKKMQTTANLFGNELHRYSIADGIRDKNVLGFDPYKVLTYRDKDLRTAIALEHAHLSKVEDVYLPENEEHRSVFEKYMNPAEVSLTGFYDTDGTHVLGVEDYITPKQYDRDEHRNAVISDILDNWITISRNSKYHAILATSSIPEAIKYYRLFKSEENSNSLKITALFDPSDNNDQGTLTKEEGIIEILTDYNNLYEKKFSLKNYDEFKQDVSLRLAHKKVYRGIENDKSKQLDLLIVVDQMLTGFDSKWLNALYLDKVIVYETIIQAFSRTNRLAGPDKPHGTIRYYRKPHTMEKNIEEAFKLYSGNKKFGIFVNKIDQNVTQMNLISEQIRILFESNGVKDYASLPEDKSVRRKFSHLFNEFNRYYEAAKIQGFEFDKPIEIKPDENSEDETITFVSSELSDKCLKEETVISLSVGISQQEYDSMLQRYKELSKHRGEGGDLPYEIKSHITEINTGLIDTNYMNSKFQKFMKVLSSGNNELIQAAMNELHQTFGTLTQEEQKYANVFIHEVQSGDVIPDENKTLRDYITEYLVKAQNDSVHNFAIGIGVDESKLKELLRLNITETNINEFGRFDALVDSVNREKAKKYFEEKNGEPESDFDLEMDIDEELRNFILCGGN